nr:cytochrome c biogenesis protein ResB [Acidithiobacillus sp.]
MRLAVHLLLFVAIASVIGTILPQQESTAHYLQQFGPFWYQIFGNLDLYDVYRCGWYMGIVAFLVLSTTSCVARNTPHMLRDMFRHESGISTRAIAAKPLHYEATVSQPVGAVFDKAVDLLKEEGYVVRRLAAQDSRLLLSAKKGRYYRFGYIFTHVAIILFCAGALYNANIPLKIAQWTGAVKPEQDFALPLSKVPKDRWLSPQQSSFRGIITIPVGQSVNAMFELVGDGFLVQQLPFIVRLDSFRVTHYRDGLAKDYVSKVTVLKPDGRVLKTHDVRVNHPLTVDGVNIYQSSYNADPSTLHLVSYSLLAPDASATLLRARVGQSLVTGAGAYTLKVDDLKVENVLPRSSVGLPARPGHGMVNMGPVARYTVLRHGQPPILVKTFLRPMPHGALDYKLVAYRSGHGQGFHFLALPMGPKEGVSLFVHYLGALENAARHGAVASSAVFQRTLAQVEQRQGVELSPIQNHSFLRASLVALQSLHTYPLPFLVLIHGLSLHWAAGLEMTKYPGMSIVYLACILLVVGIFVLFYVPRKRMWLALDDGSAGKTRIIAGGDASRDIEDFSEQFAEFLEKLAGGEQDRTEKRRRS